MAKPMHKGLKWFLILLPIFVGGYYVYAKLRKPKGRPKSDGQPETGTTPTSGGGVIPVIQQFFPLKKGSKGAKVKELQNAILSYDKTLLPKYGADSDYGSETEAAVLKLLGKKIVDSQDDIVKILGMQNTAAAKQATATANAARVSLAKTLVSAWDKNKSLKAYADHDTNIEKGIIDANGNQREVIVALIKTGALIINPSDIGLSPISKITIMPDGFIRVMLTNNKFFRFSPYAAYLK